VDDRVLDLSRQLDGTPERVFLAMTEPGQLAEWWGPAGFTTPEVSLQARVGGRYRLGMQPPEGDLFHLAGEFLVVQPPHHLVYTFLWEEPDPDDRETVVALSLVDRGGTTDLTMTQGDFATQARLELHRDGWSDSLSRLQDHLGRADGRAR